MPISNTLKKIKIFLFHYKNPVIFLSGFLFDALTIKRIDSLTDILIQIAYLGGLTLILVFQTREQNQIWTPTGLIKKVWIYNVEALHFLYGGLLSAYVILYFKSTSGSRSLVFFGLLAGLLIINEMPQVKRVGYRLRLSLYAFCLASFLIYFIPILVGRINIFLFYTSILFSGILVWILAGYLLPKENRSQSRRLALFYPGMALLILIVVLFHLKLIPPVPLSVQYHGIFHNVEKTSDKYFLTYQKPPFYRFWVKESRPFFIDEGDRAVYFTRIFAPRGFEHQVQIQWEKYEGGKFIITDRLPMQISGGRGKGFRGYTTKTNMAPGLWRITIETEDGREMGHLQFRIFKWPGGKKRAWKELIM